MKEEEQKKAPVPETPPAKVEEPARVKEESTDDSKDDKTEE